MLDDGKGDAVCEVTEGAKGFVYALDLSFTQKRDDRLVHGEDGVNVLMSMTEVMMLRRLKC